MNGTVPSIEIKISKSESAAMTKKHLRRHQHKKVSPLSPFAETDPDRVPRSVSAVISEMNEATAVLSNIIASQKFSQPSGMKLKEIDKLHTRKNPSLGITRTTNYQLSPTKVKEMPRIHSSLEDLRPINHIDISDDYASDTLDYATYQRELPLSMRKKKQKKSKKMQIKVEPINGHISIPKGPINHTLTRLSSRFCTIL